MTELKLPGELDVQKDLPQDQESAASADFFSWADEVIPYGHRVNTSLVATLQRQMDRVDRTVFLFELKQKLRKFNESWVPDKSVATEISDIIEQISAQAINSGYDSQLVTACLTRLSRIVNILRTDH